jgi:hypothetical protein
LLAPEAGSYHRKIVRIPRLFFDLLALSTTLMGASNALADSFIEGVWETPFGQIKIEKSGDFYVGKTVETSRTCGYARGIEVLRGWMDGDLFIGELQLCYEQDCHSDEWVFAMAMKVSERITGALGATPHKCPSPAFRASRTFSFSRPNAPLPPPLPPPSAIAMKPQAKEYFDMAMKDFDNGALDLAIKNLKLANGSDQNNPIILQKIGVVYKVRHNYAMARDYFKQASHADPRDSQIHYNLACVLALDGNSAGAIEALRLATKHGYNDPRTLDNDSELDSLRGLPEFSEIKRAAENNAHR